MCTPRKLELSQLLTAAVILIVGFGYSQGRHVISEDRTSHNFPRNSTGHHQKAGHSSGRKAVAVQKGFCRDKTTILIDIMVMEKEKHNETFLSSCHNLGRSATFYTKSRIHGPALSEGHCAQHSCPRSSSFDPGSFYPDFDIKSSFLQTEQSKTLTKLLGRSKTAQYFQPDKNLYFAKGHLVPNADGAYDWERKATFFYVNTVPQWQVINEGNWKSLEDSAREYAIENKVVLSIWTGAHGVLTLKDDHGSDKEIYLARTKDGQLVPGKLPAPRLMWKVIYDPVRKSGVAIIMFNDPNSENHHSKDKTLCPNICDQVRLVDWKITNSMKGFTVCCSIADFSNAFPAVSDLRHLGPISLLGSTE